MSVLSHFSPGLISLQSTEREEVAQRVYQTGCVICVSKLTTHFCTLASTPPSLCSLGFGEFSWNTHIHHCQGHKQLSISSNPLFCISKSFSCSFQSCAVTFLWLIKFDLADRAQHDAWQVTYIRGPQIHCNAWTDGFCFSYMQKFILVFVYEYAPIITFWPS